MPAAGQNSRSANAESSLVVSNASACERNAISGRSRPASVGSALKLHTQHRRRRRARLNARGGTCAAGRARRDAHGGTRATAAQWSWGDDDGEDKSRACRRPAAFVRGTAGKGRNGGEASRSDEEEEAEEARERQQDSAAARRARCFQQDSTAVERAPPLPRPNLDPHLAAKAAHWPRAFVASSSCAAARSASAAALAPDAPIASLSFA